MIKREFTAGAEEKSDARITISPGKSGIVVVIEKIPHPRFRSALTQLITQYMQAEHIADAWIRVWDFGALEFVIRARLKTALRGAEREEP